MCGCCHLVRATQSSHIVRSTYDAVAGNAAWHLTNDYRNLYLELFASRLAGVVCASGDSMLAASRPPCVHV
jgi:hypothetical protein